MNSPEQSQAAATASLFQAADVQDILRQNGWIVDTASPEQLAWCERAAPYVSAHMANRNDVAELLGLIFEYDAQSIVSTVESHCVLSRTAARGLIRQLACPLRERQPDNSA